MSVTDELEDFYIRGLTYVERNKKSDHKLLLTITYFLSIFIGIFTINAAINLFFFLTAGIYEENATVIGYGRRNLIVDYSSGTINFERKMITTTILRTNDTDAYAVIDGEFGDIGTQMTIYAARRPFLSGKTSNPLLKQKWYGTNQWNLRKYLFECVIFGSLALILLYLLRRRISPKVPYVIRNIHHYHYR